MIHSIITCDVCNKDREIHADPVNQGQGIYEGSWGSAKEAGWKALVGVGQVCPDCQYKEER